MPVDDLGPSYTRVQLSGPPEAVGQLMAALGRVGEIIFDNRTEPDARGKVACTARVATHLSPRAVASPGRAAVVMQCALTLDTAPWFGVSDRVGAERLEEDVCAALAELPGMQAAYSRVITVTSNPDTVL